MKKLFFTFLISSSFLTVQADPKSVANDVDFEISKMWESFVKGDHNMFAETMAQDPDMVTFWNRCFRTMGWMDDRKNL